MENKRLVQIRDKTFCSFIEYTPEEYLDENKQIYISDEDRLAIGRTKCFDLETLEIIDYNNSEEELKEYQEYLRGLRRPLLEAFDIYRSHVNYGTITEKDGRKDIIINWYKQILDLNEDYITKEENIPYEILYYL